MKKYAQTLVEIVLIAGITVIAALFIASIISENVRAVFARSNFTNLMHREETKFKNPNDAVQNGILETPQTQKAEDL